MKLNMDYETIDWDAEAKRVARAFRLDYSNGVTNPARFVENVKDEALSLDEQPIYRELKFQNRDNFLAIKYSREALFSCRYNQRKGMTFAVDVPSRTTRKKSQLTDITLHWRGYIASRVRDQDHARFLAKGLYHLGLLTREVEEKLAVYASEQEKAGWNAEELGINTCETMDWEAEAKRVAMAFGIEGKCKFESHEQVNYKNGILKSDGEIPLLSDILRLRVFYSFEQRLFALETATPDFSKYPIYRPLGQTVVRMTFKWNGSFTPYLINADYFDGNSIAGTILAKGLHNLSLLTPEVEASLKLPISAHQKLEWTLQHEARRQAANDN